MALGQLPGQLNGVLLSKKMALLQQLSNISISMAGYTRDMQCVTALELRARLVFVLLCY